MKKIIFIFFILLLCNPCYAIDEDIIFLPNDEIKTEKDLLEGEKEVILEEKTNPYSKKALKGIVEKEYDLNSAKGMFNEQLKAEFKRGIIKNAGVQLNVIQTFDKIINADNRFDSKYKLQTLQLGLKGKFRSGKEGYNFLFEFSPNIHDNFAQRLVADAWIETSRVKNHTILFGTSRTPVGYEGGRSAYIIPFLSRSQIARTLGNSRKTGIRVKGDYKYVNYDIGGYSSDTFYTEFLPGAETDIWVNLKPLANIKDKYGSLNIGGGFQIGERNSHDFLVSTAALRYDYKKFWMSAEYANSDGSNGGSGITDKKAQGYNVTLAYRLTKKLEFLLRFDDFDSDKKKSNNKTKEYTAGINYFILGQTARLILNYVFCQNDGKTDSHRLILGSQFLL